MVRGVVILAILAGVGVAAVRAFGLLGGNASSEIDTIPAYVAAPMRFEVRLSSLGAIEAASNRQIVSPYSGKVLNVLPEGTFVEEGVPVVWMETTEYEDRLKEEEVQLKLAQSDLEQAQQDYSLLLVRQELDETSLKAKVDFQERKLQDADKQYENTVKMVESSLAPVSDLEDRKIEQLQAKLSLEEAKIALDKFQKTRESEIKISQSKIDKAQATADKSDRDVQDTKKDIDDAVLRAPGRGHISYIPMRMGSDVSKVSEGAQVYHRTPLIQIPDSSTMLAKVPINEVDITKVEVGQQAEVRIQAFPNKIYPGEVTKKSIVPVSDSSMRRFLFGGSDTSVREFEVTVKLRDEDPNLRQGMTASVDLLVQEGSERLAIPQEAVFQDGSTNVVFKRKGQGFEVCQVDLGLSNANYVEALQGVQPGDALLLRNPTEQIEKVGALEALVPASPKR